jgi:hypothetical protein
MHNALFYFHYFNIAILSKPMKKAGSYDQKKNGGCIEQNMSE